MTVLTENTVLTNISNKHTSIRSGVIEDTNIGMMLIVDTEIEEDPIQQLQFDSTADIDFLICKLTELKLQMQILMRNSIT